MPYAYPCDPVSTDERHRVTCEDPVPSLEWDFRGAGVSEAYVVAPRKEVNLPGLVSNSLLAENGSVHSVCNRAATID